MAKLGEYVVTICCAALLCGIVNAMMPKGTAKELLKIVGGLFLVFTIIQPVQNVQLPEAADYGAGWQEEANIIIAQGEEMARQAAMMSIKQELEAYILDKAQALRLEIRAQLKLNEETLHPESLTIIGKGAPEARNQLNSWICRELGLTQEEITWIS